MSQQIPIVLIHKFNIKPQKTDYASHAINQSVFFDNTTFSITDYCPASKLTDKHINLNFKEYVTDDFIMFDNHYVHMSTNPFEFEKACLLRYFILKEFMLKNKFNKIFHIDSDVLLYTKVQDVFDAEAVDYSLSSEQHIANSLLSLAFIEDFCEKITKAYVDKQKNFWFRYMENIYNKMQKENKRGGINDMTFLQHYKTKKECGNPMLRYKDMNEIIDDCTFDFSMKHDKGKFKMVDGLKAIKFNNGIPFCFNEDLQKYIRFLSLHFLGNTKQVLEKYITYT
jgi:hypothetical protein